jgi:hypothetical protein
MASRRKTLSSNKPEVKPHVPALWGFQTDNSIGNVLFVKQPSGKQLRYSLMDLHNLTHKDKVTFRSLFAYH